MLALAAVPACTRHAPAVLPRKQNAAENLGLVRPEAIGAPAEGRPWIAQVAPVDLDRDGLLDVLACEAQKGELLWLRQAPRGHFEEQALARSLRAPVHAEAVDFDGDGDLDVLVACMGQVFPNNEKIGSIVALENDGAQRFAPHLLLEHVARVTDVRAGDFDGDGRPDLAVAQFGYDEGEIRWMQNTGGWTFKNHELLGLSGAINVCVADMNGDRTADIVAVVSQQWEEIHLFANDGTGAFTSKVIFASTNEDFGSSGISLCDLDRDGRPDVLASNGDGFDYAEPGARPWHGVQWLENLGDGFFRHHRIGDLPGAYSPVAVDLDGDGATDVLAVSGFNDWANPASAALMLFRNRGDGNFDPLVLAHAPTHLLAAAAGDFDGDGRAEFVTGGFHAYPPFEAMSRITLWRRPAP